MVRLSQSCPRKMFPTQHVLLAILDFVTELTIINARGGDGSDTHPISHKQNSALRCVSVLLYLKIFFNKIDTLFIPEIAVLIPKDITGNTWGKRDNNINNNDDDDDNNNNNWQLLNSAFVGYEEFCRSRRVLSTEAFDESRNCGLCVTLSQYWLVWVVSRNG